MIFEPLARLREKLCLLAGAGAQKLQDAKFSLQQGVVEAARRSPFLARGVNGLRKWRRSRRSSYNVRPFVIVNIELTNKCPLRCVMCPRTNNMTRPLGLMEFDVFRKVIDEYVEANPHGARFNSTWLHHFGESLVHPEFGRFMRYAVSKGVKAGMSVNPIMLTKPVARELLEARPAQLCISLDGHDDKSFMDIRGLKDAYDKSKENLLEFLKLKIEMGSKTHVVLQMIDFSLNRASIAALEAYWKNVPGIDESLCKNFTTWNGDAGDVNRFTEAPRPANAVLAARFGYAGCTRPWETLSVAWDGEVLSCCFDYDKKYPLGSVKEMTLAEIWNGPRMRALREEFLSNRVTNPLCRDCEYLYDQTGYAFRA